MDWVHFMKKNRIVKWHQLKNKYWLKITFFKIKDKERRVFFKSDNIWSVDIVVTKTKRQANDHYCKSCGSKKFLYLQSTNNRGGIESLLIALEELKRFKEWIPKGHKILVSGTDDQRTKVYSRLLRYGYEVVRFPIPETEYDLIPRYVLEYYVTTKKED